MKEILKTCGKVIAAAVVVLLLVAAWLVPSRYGPIKKD